MRKPSRFCAIIALLLLTVLSAACNVLSSIVHDDNVVAKIGKEKLYRSEVTAVLPSGLAEEDSVRLVRQYVEAWATDVLYCQMAEKHLSKQNLDFKEELEAYRKSLLKFRYQEQYISERLDTIVTESQIREYYNSHSDLLQLERPVLKVIYIDLMKANATEIDRFHELDSSIVASALKYFDSSNKWMDAAILAREFGVDFNTMLSHLSGNVIEMSEGGRGDVKLALVYDIQYSGKAPYDFCKESIRDIILGQRKRTLNANLEQDLLKDAMKKNKLVIY